jgi:hypothetical protein
LPVFRLVGRDLDPETLPEGPREEAPHRVGLPAGRLDDLLDGGAGGALQHGDELRLLGVSALALRRRHGALRPLLGRSPDRRAGGLGELQRERDTLIVRAPDLLLRIGRHLLDGAVRQQCGEDLLQRSALQVRRDRQDHAALPFRRGGDDLALGLGQFGSHGSLLAERRRIAPSTTARPAWPSDRAEPCRGDCIWRRAHERSGHTGESSSLSIDLNGGSGLRGGLGLVARMRLRRCKQFIRDRPKTLGGSFTVAEPRPTR